MPPVKYAVSVTERALVAQFYLPIATAALAADIIERFQALFADMRAELERGRDQVARELASRGVCPWCNDLAHPEGVGCAAC